MFAGTDHDRAVGMKRPSHTEAEDTTIQQQGVAGNTDGTAAGPYKKRLFLRRWQQQQQQLEQEMLHQEQRRQQLHLQRWPYKKLLLQGLNNINVDNNVSPTNNNPSSPCVPSSPDANNMGRTIAMASAQPPTTQAAAPPAGFPAGAAAANGTGAMTATTGLQSQAAVQQRNKLYLQRYLDGLKQQQQAKEEERLQAAAAVEVMPAGVSGQQPSCQQTEEPGTCSSGWSSNGLAW